MITEVQRTTDAHASQFSAGGTEAHHVKRVQREESTTESDTTDAPAGKRTARIAQRVCIDVPRLFQELREKTTLAIKDIQYLKTKADPSDATSVAEVVFRFFDVPCPRDNAVKLQEGGFLHANYVTDERSYRTFVASQYPSDLPLFWKFIFEQLYEIVDLSNDSAQYIPVKTGEEQTFCSISVKLIDQLEESTDYSIFLYEVRSLISGQSQSIRRLVAKGWTSRGSISLQTLHTLVSKLESDFSLNTLIHCSAGVGRTGTLIAAYFLKQQILSRQIRPENLRKGIIELLITLRKQRGAMFVQSPDQLNLLVEFATDLLRGIPEQETPSKRSSQSTEEVTCAAAASPHDDIRQSSAISSFGALMSIQLSEVCSPKIAESVISELPGTKVRFDRATNTLHFGYGSTVIRALSERSPALEKIVGYGYRTVFDGYVSEHIDGWRLPKASSQIATLLEDAKKCFADIPRHGPLPLVVPDNPSEKDLLIHCLQTGPGICIGECHHHTAAKDFLCEYLPMMVAQGVTTLFMEHIPSESLQDEIECFLSSPTASMPTALSTYLDHLTRNNRIEPKRHGFMEVIIAAKAAGITKIVCVDTEETYTVGLNKRDGYMNLAKRVLAMNYNALQLISAQKGTGKYIIFAGGKHVTTCCGIPGLAELTGCASWYISDVQSRSDQKIERDVMITDEDILLKECERNFHFDVALKRVPFQL